MKKVYEHMDRLPQGRTHGGITPGCLVLEGGGWKGLYTVGALDALMMEGINLEAVVGISAGAMSGFGYLSGQIGMSVRLDLGFRFDRRYVGAKAYRMDGGITNFTYLYNRILNEVGFDWKSFRDSKQRFAAGAANMLTGKVEYFEKGRSNIFKAVRASAALPLVTRPVMIDGVPYLDGGCAEKIPYGWAKDQGYSKIVVIKTREWDYRRSGRENAIVKAYYYKKYPNFVRAMDEANGRFNRMTDELWESYQAGEIFALAPSQPVEVTRFDSDLDKLADLYYLGLSDMREHMDELKTYLRDSVSTGV